MTNYRRNFVAGGSYFFTVNLADRRSRLLTDNIELLRAAFRDVRHRHPFGIDAIVVLPDHLHAVWTLPEGDADFSLRWSLIKAGFSRDLPQRERVSASRLRKRERAIWQRRYWEHTIRGRRSRCWHERRCEPGPRLAPVGPQGPPARRAARLAMVASRSRGSLLWTTGTTRSPATASTQGGQFFVSPGGQFRMSFDSERHLTLFPRLVTAVSNPLVSANIVARRNTPRAYFAILTASR